MTSRKNNNQNCPFPVADTPSPSKRVRLLITMVAPLTAGVILLSIIAVAQAPPPQQQTAMNTAEKHLAEILSFARDDGFVYRREGRADPFVPFITAEMLKAERNKSDEELSGLQRLEPGQLSLVAIVFSGNTAVAMAQDSGGMGYLIRQGMQIGQTGVVDAIVANSVIIKQKYQTISGKSRYRKVEMVLKKEGEK